MARATGKYLLVTGAITTDQRFRLSKFFLQILAGVNGAQIIVDPAGDLVFGPTHRIPFDVTQADFGIDAILTSPLGEAIDFRLEAPDGTIIGPSLPAKAGSLVIRRSVVYYRLPMPFLGGSGGILHSGRWHALLKLDEERVKKLLSDERRRDEILREIRKGSAAYNFLVHAHSTLTFETSCTPGVVRPGDAALVTTSLTEFGTPLMRRAEAWIDLVSPNGTTQMVGMTEVGPGSFSAKVQTFMPGLHDLRVRARGVTLHGVPFTRDAIHSLIAGGDERPPRREETRSGTDAQILRLMESMLHQINPQILGVSPDNLSRLPDRAGNRDEPRLPKEPSAARRAIPKAVPEMLSGAPIARLTEPLPPLEFPHVEHDAEMPMFSLSPEDLKLEEDRVRGGLTQSESAKSSDKLQPGTIDRSGQPPVENDKERPAFGLSSEDQQETNAPTSSGKSEKPTGASGRRRARPRRSDGEPK